MNLLKICSLILFYFISRVALAAHCETFQGYKTNEEMCWHETLKGWVSKSCLKENSKCDFHLLLSEKKKVTLPEGTGGQNPAALICHHLKLEVIVLRDKKDNEQSFCVFKDKSKADANLFLRLIK